METTSAVTAVTMVPELESDETRQKTPPNLAKATHPFSLFANSFICHFSAFFISQ
jgi:hypothetical protein